MSRCHKLDRSIYSIHHRLLHTYLYTFSTQICNLFNFIIRCSTIPSHWKCSIVIPIHKKGATDMFENYPISVNFLKECFTSKLSIIQNTTNYCITDTGLDVNTLQQPVAHIFLM
jgi:hypothetical protein